MGSRSLVLSVDYDLVVKPAEDHEVVLVGFASFSPWCQVVDLKPVRESQPSAPHLWLYSASNARLNAGGASVVFARSRRTGRLRFWL